MNNNITDEILRDILFEKVLTFEPCKVKDMLKKLRLISDKYHGVSKKMVNRILYKELYERKVIFDRFNATWELPQDDKNVDKKELITVFKIQEGEYALYRLR